ncbi:PUA-like domain-containing protein [Trametes meyenii]|nr:PUA-like domain-containing protein [Trametes meyenii]
MNFACCPPLQFIFLLNFCRLSIMGFSSKPAIKRTQSSNVFGHIKGVPVGSTFENRLFLHHSSVHTGILAGISGSKHDGCYSVVLSGGYEDDKDEGYRFTYTGCGGRDTKDGEKPREGPQTCDQSWSNSRNMSLKVSAYTGKPVRVIRGYKSSSDFAPTQGYRYDGLYVVEQAWMDVGKSGFKVCKVSMTRLPDQPPIPRRQGTLHLDLSVWEQPRHFGRGCSPTSSSPAPRVSRNGGQRIVLTARGGVPLIRRPRTPASDDDSIEVFSDEDDMPTPRASPTSQILSLPKIPPVASPIPLTTNVAAAGRKNALPAQQTASHAPQPDVMSLLEEWSGSAAKRG